MYSVHIAIRNNFHNPMLSQPPMRAAPSAQFGRMPHMTAANVCPCHIPAYTKWTFRTRVAVTEPGLVSHGYGLNREGSVADFTTPCVTGFDQFHTLYRQIATSPPD